MGKLAEGIEYPGYAPSRAHPADTKPPTGLLPGVRVGGNIDVFLPQSKGKWESKPGGHRGERR